MNEELRELQDQKFALDQAAIVAMTDAYGKILSANEQFCKISGYSEKELLGKDHRLINSGVHSKEFFQNMWKTIQSGQVWRGDICNRSKEGRLYWVSTTIVPLLNTQGVPAKYLAIRQDITELKLAQKTILDQQEKLIATSKLSALGEMAAAITHEINNPLGVILGRVEMMKKLLQSKDLNYSMLERIADTIDITGRRIEKIVRSMRVLAHHGYDNEPFTACRLSEILQDSMDLCSQRFRNHGINISLPRIDESILIEARSYQIVQVLVNLLNNAHDAIQNQKEKWIRIEMMDLGNCIELAVTDSGPGIPEKIREKMFQPFFTTKDVKYGTGLGLSISMGIIHQHHGSLVYDEENAFTRFLLRLPKKQLSSVEKSSDNFC